MTLKENFSQILMEFWASDWEGQCEQVADEFAIGFAEWCLAYFYISLQTGIDAKADTMEELLEIYKKENQL